MINWFLNNFAVCVLNILAPQTQALLIKDEWQIIKQNCQNNICVTCLVSNDKRNFLGEVWTYCQSNGVCSEIETQQFEFFEIPFGACERGEVR